MDLMTPPFPFGTPLFRTWALNRLQVLQHALGMPISPNFS